MAQQALFLKGPTHVSLTINYEQSLHKAAFQWLRKEMVEKKVAWRFFHLAQQQAKSDLARSVWQLLPNGGMLEVPLHPVRIKTF